MIHIPTVSEGTVQYCFHFRQHVNKPFKVRLGQVEFQLCAEHAELLIKGLDEQLQAERQEPPLVIEEPKESPSVCPECGQSHTWKHMSN